MRLPAASYEAAGRQFTLSCKGCITGKVTAPTYQITLNTLHDVLLLSKFRICRISKRLRGARMWRLCTTAHSQQ